MFGDVCGVSRACVGGGECSSVLVVGSGGGVAEKEECVVGRERIEY